MGRRAGDADRRRELDALAQSIGATIRVVRQRKGIKAIELELACKVSQPAVAQWEAGKTLLGLDRLVAVAEVLGIPAWMLLRLAEERARRVEVFEADQRAARRRATSEEAKAA